MSFYERLKPPTKKKENTQQTSLRAQMQKHTSTTRLCCFFFTRSLMPEPHGNQMTQSGHSKPSGIDFSALVAFTFLFFFYFFFFFYEPKVYFNRVFHNIWQLKPENICTVEVGNKPGVPWRDNSSGYREKQAVRWTALGTEGIYYTLSNFPVLSVCSGRTQKSRKSFKAVRESAVPASPS